jgi:WD40 repeat protein
MRIFKGHEKSVYAIGITPDNTRLVSVSRDDTIRLWDLNTGVVQWQNRVFPAQANLAISPDGKHLATACISVGSISLWNLDNGKRIRELIGGRNGYLAFSPDGKQLAAAFEHHFGLWDTTFGKTVPWTAMNPPGIHRCVAFSPDGKRMLGGADHHLTVWQREPFGIVDRLHGLNGTASHISYSADGRFVSGISTKHLCVWDLRLGRVVWEDLLENRYFQAAAFSPDGRTLATAANTASVQFYDTSTWQMKAEYTWKIGPVLDVTFAPDGLRAAASGRNGKIVVWDVDE